MHDGIFWFFLVRIINVRWRSHLFFITVVHVVIVLNASNHTLSETHNYMKITWTGFMFGDPYQIRYLDNFSKLFDFVGKVLHADIYDGIPCLFVFFRPGFGLESQSGYQPLSWFLQFYFWLWRCCFHLVQIVKLLWDIQNLINIQGDTLVTTLVLLVFPNFATTIVFMFTDSNKSCLPVNFPPRTSSEWSNHDK